MIQVGVIKEREGSAGVAAQSYGSTDWPQEKGQLEAMRGEELPKWLFSLLFLCLWPGQWLSMVIYEHVGE